MQAAQRDPGGPKQVEETLDEVWKDLVRLGREAKVVARLRWARAKLQARERAHGLVLATWGALAAAVLTAAACVLLLVGLSGALGALFGSAWAGQLATGVLFLGAIVGGLAALRARMRRSFLAHVRRRFAAQVYRSDARG